MKDYLVFRLYGSMVSWGSTAVGEYRPSFDHPSKSAIMGLLAAALGVRRENEQMHRELAEAYDFAVEVNASGTLFRDYHTTQVPPNGSGRNKRAFITRKDELSVPKDSINTVLSRRDYYCDSLYTVFVWPRNINPPYHLETLMQRLKEPVFTLYLGRKSCPLAMPLQTQIISGSNLKDVLSKVSFEDEEFLKGLPREDNTRLYWEGDEEGLHAEHTISRRDTTLSRRRWQFTDRKEHYMMLHPGEL